MYINNSPSKELRRAAKKDKSVAMLDTFALKCPFSEAQRVENLTPSGRFQKRAPAWKPPPAPTPQCRGRPQPSGASPLGRVKNPPPRTPLWAPSGTSSRHSRGGGTLAQTPIFQKRESVAILYTFGLKWPLFEIQPVSFLKPSCSFREARAAPSSVRGAATFRARAHK